MASSSSQEFPMFFLGHPCGSGMVSGGPDTHGAVDPTTHDVAEQSTTGSDQCTWRAALTVADSF